MSSEKKTKGYSYGVMYSGEVGVWQGGIPFRISRGDLPEEETVKYGMGYDEDGIFDPELYLLHKKHQYNYSAW